MPQVVDLGPSYGLVSFPDSHTDEQILADYEELERARNTPPTPPTLSTLDYAKNVGGRLLRGVAGMVASVPEELAIASSGLARLTGTNDAIAGQGDPYKAEDRASYQLGQAIRRGAEYIAPTNRALDDSFLASKLPEGIGSAIGFMAGGVAGKALKIPAWLAIGGLGSASSGADFYHDAKASGADEGTAQLASVFGNAVGTSEAFPLARMMHRLDGITGNTFSRSVIEAGKDTIEEALQEGAQQLAQNFTAQQLYDKDRALFNEVATNAGVGGATGFLMSAVTQALGIPIGRSRVRREEQDQSRERIRRVIAQRESEADASQVGTQPQAPGQEAQVGQEEVGGVRLRDDAPGVRLEAQPGTPITLPAATPIQPPISTGPADASALGAGAATTPISPEPLKVTTPAQSSIPAPAAPDVVQEAIDTLFAPQPQEAPMQFVGRVVRDITSRWQNAPEIQLVDTGDQLPDEVRAKASAEGQSINDVDAVRDSKGTVWIVADKVKSAGHASRLLLHEAIGHEGVDSVFGTKDDWNKFMQGVAQKHASTPLGAEIRGLYGNDPLTVGKEIVARLAENPQADPTLWQQIVAAVRNWARRVLKVEVSDNDVQVLLSRGRRAVEAEPQTGVIGRSRYFLESGGRILHAKNATVVGPAAFAISSFHGTKHKVDKFKTEKIGTGEGSQAYGWGLYFADVKDVAETYQRIGNDAQLFINGVHIPQLRTRAHEPKNLAIREVISFGNINDAIANLKRVIDEAGYHRFNEDNEYTEALDILKGWNSHHVEVRRAAGNLYSVSLNIEPDDLLDWDKRLSDQSDNIKRRIKDRTYPEEGYYSIHADLTGKEVYYAIREMLRGSLVGWSELEHALDKSGLEPSDLLQDFLSMQDEHQYQRDGNSGNAFSHEFTIEDQKNILEEISKFSPELAIRLGGYAKSNYKTDEKRIASEYLRGLGIKGIRFLDRGSRASNRLRNYKTLGRFQIVPKETYSNEMRPGERELYERFGAMPDKEIRGNDVFVQTRSPEEHAAWRDWYKARGELIKDIAQPVMHEEKLTYNYVIFNDADISITHENGQPVPVREAMGGTAFSVSESTSYFPRRSTVIAATSNPGLTPSQIQEAEDLADVQAHMVTQGMTGWLMGTPADKVEKRAQKILDYLLDRAYLSQNPRPLSSLPEGTDEETRTKQLAGYAQLTHHAVDRSVLANIHADIDAAQLRMQEAVAKTSSTTYAQHKANFLTALFNRLTTDYNQYLKNRTAAAPASGNIAAQWREKLTRAQQRLNDQSKSPIALEHALSAIARTIPDSVLQPSSTNQAVVDWVVQNGALFNVVGQNVQDWLLVDDGTGSPALIGYTRLIEDLITLKDILLNGAAVEADIVAFETWFRNNSTATGKVAPKALAEKYYAFRLGRDRALKIVASTEKEIDMADLVIRSNVMARDRLETMMQDPAYKAAVRDAAAKADIVILSLYHPTDGNIPAVGLINRNKAVGSYKLKGPISGVEFAVDLYPSSAGEAENMANLAAWAAEARAWALGHTDSDPLLADRYNDLADYVEKHLMSPSMDPRNGFTMTRVKLPGTNIRMALDPFDMITSLTGTIGYSWQTVRDVIERVGGRVMREAFKDAHVLDTVMRKVEAIDHHPEYGRAAQTQAVLKALESHGWSPDQEKTWEEQVAEPVLASGQNRLSPVYEVNDFVVGSGVKLTAADVAALRVMKRWGDAIIAVAPHSIQDRLADLGVSRRAIGNGKFTGHRVQAQWTENFFKAWNEAKDDAAKENLLSGDEEFRRVVLGYLAEFNVELAKMNPASSEKSPLFELYRRLADTEKKGVQTFRSMQEVIDFLAEEGVDRYPDKFPDYITAAGQIHTTLLTEIKDFIADYEKHVIYRVSTDVYGGVPPGVVQRLSSKNAFTTPRGRLQAPSTFYTYSTATAARQQMHVGNLRSILNLKLLQSAYEATKAIESKKAQMQDRVKVLTDMGVSAGKARKQIQKETAAERELGEIRYDLREITTALQAIEQAFFKNLERYELSTADHYEHAGVAAANTFFSAIKSSLLSSLQAMSTNFWTGGILGPALAHWQSGQFGRAMGDVVIQPVLMAKTVMKRVSAMVDNNPTMHRLLRQHSPMWHDIAESVIKGAADWRRVQQIAQSSGMVNPYNLGTVLKNMSALKRTAGRFVNDDPHRLAEAVNVAMSAPGVRHATEGLKATIPREIDNIINYMMVENWNRETEFLKKVGWAAFKIREDTASATGANWKDLTQKANVLTPGDLGLKTNKGLEWYRQLFIPLGSLDAVLLDYYERTKNMTADQREAEPLLNDDDHAALALQYASKSNVSTETNRPYSLKGKGSDGVWRNIVGTFMGWPINMMHQLSKGLQTHSGDKGFPKIASSMIGIATIVVLLAAVGAWNWEFGDELTKGLYDVSSARVQIGNIKDWQTGLLYFAQSLVNTVPMIGSSIGGLFGVAYTGRGNPFDMTSLSPHIGFVAGIYNTVKRVAQTGDASLPLLDFTRQWVPMSKIIVNRLPIVRGMVDQQNAVRSMNASAPPGTEIKWGKRGGDVKYGPANDEITKLIASAYEAARGGDPANVQARLQDAVAAYVRAGRSPDDAMKALTSALSAKEPVRILTGREMTPEEEAKWVARMTPSQKADYDKAVAAWQILSNVTGKDFNMITTKGQGGGGGSASTPSRAVGLGGGPLRAGLAAGSIGIGSLTGPRFATGLGGRRRGTRGTTRRRRSSIGSGTTRRRLGPRVSTVSTRRRSTIGTRRRRSYSTA